MVRGEFADYGIRIDKQLVAFIEVKRITTKLSDKHLRQVEMYAVNEGVEWMILTNGAVWQVYHLDTATKPAGIGLVTSVDLLSDDPPAAKVHGLFPLTVEAMRHGVIDGIWRAKRATSPGSLAKVLASPTVVTAVRRELRRQTGFNVDEKDLAALLAALFRGQ